MRKWHTATEALNLVDKTMKWVKTVDVDVAVPPNFIITEDDDICKRITALRPLSFDTELLYVAGKGTLGCKAIQTILTKLFSSCSSITALDCTLFGQVENGVTTTHIDVIKSALCGICTGKILIPINCIGNHWCGIMIDMEAGKINYYDPMQSSYTKDVRALAERIASLLPMPNTERIRVIPYSTDMGIQMDTYNCGVYVLLAFEMFADPEASELQQITRKALAYLRYRYLVLCV
ncbi:hypothetical protein V7S43_018256 [Phytophthora oleae]|uniref:Ubiquitin-like protease family profile domain-containing protein n=1 Tax=Phytophthora oleae TaxID=2107226 RepID=A0ABD3EUL1_9STRA